MEAELQQQRAIRLELEQTRADFDEKESRELQTKYRELLSAVSHARAQLTATERQLKSAEADRELLRQAEQAIDGAAHVIAVGSPIATALQKKGAPQTPRPIQPAELVVGSRVHVKKWNLEADVLEITPKGEVKVSAGVLRATLGLDELQRPQNGTRPRPAAPVKQKTKKAKNEASASAARTTPVRVDSNTLDLRGMRVDESLEQVDAFIDSMLRSGERAAFVLHGHGTGALKQAVRSHLRDSLHVLDSAPAAPEDGGDAFTVFWLPSD
jgi:DNA mismatch repair protein MutS2